MLTLQKIQALQSQRFAVSILTRDLPPSPLFLEFRQKCPNVEVIAITLPEGFKVEAVREYVAHYRGEALTGKDRTVDDAIIFNTYASELVNRGDWDLVSCSFLTDLFGLEPRCPVVFHIYGLPPTEMIPEEIPLLQRVSAISAVSAYIRNEFCSLFADEIVASEVTLLSPSVTDYFSSSPIRASRDIHFAYVGRLTHRKGVDTAIKALACIITPPTARPMLVIAGDGPERLNLQQLSLELGMESMVKFVGELDAKGVKNLLDRVRWFLHPGRMPEAFGIAGLEAMARGVPCIVSAPGGMREYLCHGQNGFEIETSDVLQFAQRMRAVLRKDFPEEDFRRRASSTAGKFTWLTFKESVNTFYGDALKT